MFGKKKLGHILWPVFFKLNWQWNQKKKLLILTLFRMEGRQKGPPTSFSPVTSTNVRISPQNFPQKTFWLLILTLLTDWCIISSLHLVPVPNCWTSTKTTPQKKRFFCPNLYKIVMITSFIQMLELPNFGHMTTSII